MRRRGRGGGGVEAPVPAAARRGAEEGVAAGGGRTRRRGLLLLLAVAIGGRSGVAPDARIWAVSSLRRLWRGRRSYDLVADEGCARLHRCSAETAALGDGARRRRTSSDLRDGDATAVAEEVEEAAVARWRRRRERASAAEFEGTADMTATSRTARTAMEAATES
uniref:Uncharacterized protein n=2 Tax=Oryza TaxID=4527 RepID=A0A0E0N9R7_ORYRU